MNIRLPVLLILAFIIGLSACKKNNDAPTITLKSNLNIINASADTVNFYLNGTRLNNNSNLYPLVTTGYLSTVPVGNQNFQVKKMFNPVTNTVQTLFSVPITLDVGTYYSLFITGETQAQSFSTLDFTTAQLSTLLAATNNSDTAQNTSYIRFVNASPTAGNLDVAVGDTVKFQNVPFKTAGTFTIVNSGLKTINIYQHGSATPVLTRQLLMSGGFVYTIYSLGALNGTGNSAFSIGGVYIN